MSRHALQLPPGKPLEPVRGVALGGWSAELLPRGAYRASYVAARPVTGFAFDAQSGDHAFGGDRRTGFRGRANGLACVPVGCDVYASSPTGGEYLRILGAREHDAATDTARFSDRIDAASVAAAHALRRELLAPGTPDALACERWVLALEQRVAAMRGRSPERATGWMTTRRLRLVDELIQERLDTALTIDELAAALGLSAGFFSRAFRAATGQTPHAWIVERRLARARVLLCTSETSLSTIAADCGFSSHSHLTARFRAQFGVVPSRFRDGVRSFHAAAKTRPRSVRTATTYVPDETQLDGRPGQGMPRQRPGPKG